MTVSYEIRGTNGSHVCELDLHANQRTVKQSLGLFKQKRVIRKSRLF